MKKIGVILIVLIGITTLSLMPLLSRDGREDVTITEEFRTLDVKVKNANIEIVPTDKQATEIQLIDKKKNHRLHTMLKKDTLEVEVKSNRFLHWFSFDLFSNFSLPTLIIYLPQQEYDLIQVKTDNGKVEAEQVEASEVDVETDNGEINLRQVVGSSVTAKTDNGRINMDRVEGNMVGKTDNGKITLNTESLDQFIHLETDNGAIEVWTKKEPENTTFEIKTDNGRIEVFGSSSYDTVIGEGEHLIKLETDNGRVTVDRE